MAHESWGASAVRICPGLSGLSFKPGTCLTGGDLPGLPLTKVRFGGDRNRLMQVLLPLFKAGCAPEVLAGGKPWSSREGWRLVDATHL